MWFVFDMKRFRQGSHISWVCGGCGWIGLARGGGSYMRFNLLDKPLNPSSSSWVPLKNDLISVPSTTFFWIRHYTDVGVRYGWKRGPHPHCLFYCSENFFWNFLKEIYWTPEYAWGILLSFNSEKLHKFFNQINGFLSLFIYSNLILGQTLTMREFTQL